MVLLVFCVAWAMVKLLVSKAVRNELSIDGGKCTIEHAVIVRLGGRLRWIDGKILRATWKSDVLADHSAMARVVNAGGVGVILLGLALIWLSLGLLVLWKAIGSWAKAKKL